MRMANVPSVHHGRLRLPIALASAVVVAEAAVILLRPRRGVIDPEPVSARSYFSQDYLDRARRFRRPQLALFGGQMLVEGAILALLARRPPARLRARFRHPLLAAATAGAAGSVTLTVATLPLAAVGRRRAKDVGLVTQSWGGWAADVAKSTAIGAAFSAAGGALLLGGMRRLPRTWWLPGAGMAVGVGALFLFAGPVVLDPLFNKFEPLPAGRTRSAVLALGERAGVKVGEVYEVDASRRTTGANAYVTGLGRTKRVVLFDTLLTRFSPAETDLVVAHELAHVHYRDVPRGLLYLSMVAPAALFAGARLGAALLPPGVEPGTPAALPATALALGIVAALVGTVSNQLSRRMEARADTYSLELTGEPAAFIASERRLVEQNVVDPDPPAWVTWLLGTHPPALQRIGAGVAFERQAR
jgi:STE24 endopeptidase